jgi:hypothetical protein
MRTLEREKRTQRMKLAIWGGMTEYKADLETAGSYLVGDTVFPRCRIFNTYSAGRSEFEKDI